MGLDQVSNMYEALCIHLQIDSNKGLSQTGITCALLDYCLTILWLSSADYKGGKGSEIIALCFQSFGCHQPKYKVDEQHTRKRQEPPFLKYFFLIFALIQLSNYGIIDGIMYRQTGIVFQLPVETHIYTLDRVKAYRTTQFFFRNVLTY